MTTRIKVKCTETGEMHYSYSGAVKQYRSKFAAVYGDSEENKKFFAATPSATIEFGVTSHQPFEAGKEYYIDITDANGDKC